MTKKMRVFIGGKEYPLRGDNEKLIQMAANEVNSQLEQLSVKHYDESEVRLSVLAALNIAEKQLKLQQQFEIDKRFVVKELGKITNFIKDNIELENKDR